MKIKIVFIVEAMLGGIRRHVCEIISSLDQERYDITLIYSDLRADDGFQKALPELTRKAECIRCNEMKRELGPGDLKACAALIRKLRRIRPDIVHCHSSKAGIVGRAAARLCGVKRILYTPNAYAFQNPDVSAFQKGLYIAAEFLLSRLATTCTINVSKGEQAYARRYRLMKPGRLRLIYNGIPDREPPGRRLLRESFGFGQDTVLIGFTGRCAAQKDPMTWLQIAKVMASQDETVKFVYIGDGPKLREMRKWVSEEKLEDRICLTGFCEEASVLVGMFDIYLSTALYEGMPYSMIEAMRAGVPIVATDVVGNNELVTEGVNGYLFSAGSIAGGVGKLTKQLTDRAVTAEAVRKEFRGKFSLCVMMEKTEALYAGG